MCLPMYSFRYLWNSWFCHLPVACVLGCTHFFQFWVFLLPPQKVCSWILCHCWRVFFCLLQMYTLHIWGMCQLFLLHFLFSGMQNVNPVSMHITVSTYWCPCNNGGLILPIRSIDMNFIGWTLGANVFFSNAYVCVCTNCILCNAYSIWEYPFLLCARNNVFSLHCMFFWICCVLNYHVMLSWYHVSMLMEWHIDEMFGYCLLDISSKYHFYLGSSFFW